MALSAQDAMIHLMVVAASADSQMTERELARIEGLIARLPVFAGYDLSRLTAVANACVDRINTEAGIEGVLERAVAALPDRLQDTAYAVTVEVVAVDLHLRQEELRFLEMLRDRLSLDRLVTAAIEAAARARYRHA